MKFSQPMRRLVPALHLTVSVGWIGAVIAYLVLAVAGGRTHDPAVVRGSWLSMELIGWTVIVPLAVASLATGVALALGTKWGLLRHYWVLMSFAGTVICTGVLIAHMPGVDEMAQTARNASAHRLLAMPADIVHPLVGLLLLIGILVLNIHKPKGLTRRGWRLGRAELRAAELDPSGTRSDLGSLPG